MNQILHTREMSTLLKCGTWLLIAFYGEPDLMSAVIGLIARLAR